ncbi:MAG: SGNH/GDSL hydrolase family protein, partial [Abditibacteriota bacterium]|nr:SGNH/GDSL hydrolase family protein [Abditibacteriota bacterium]
NGITVERSPLRVPLPGTGGWQGRGALWTRPLTSAELSEYARGKRVSGAIAVNNTKQETREMNNSLDVYDRAKYMLPIWSSGVIYHETVMFVEGDRRASLALPAAEIYEVRSSDLQTVFVPGRDYTLADGDLILTDRSAIPVMPLGDFYPDPASAAPGTYFESTVEGHPLLGFSETPKFIEKQISVTYRPGAKWQGPVPRCQPKFDRFLTKLFSGEPVTVVYYGDSISTGANSSSIYGRSPNAENWCRMSCSVMEDLSGNKNVKYVNTAVGGMESLWAVDNIEERVIAYKPDLLIYAFGMNDHTKPAEEFIRLTDLSVQKVQAACPGCDILLVSTMLPHKRAGGFWNNQDIYEPAMEDYVRGREHVGLAPVTSMHRYLLTRKEYYHATGNNVNHPNDFLARIYAQTVIKVIFDR